MKRKGNNFMKVSKAIRCLLVASLFIVIEGGLWEVCWVKMK